MHPVSLHIAVGEAALADVGARAAVLDDTERARAAGLRLEADRGLYRAAHVLLREALSMQVPIAPERWRFVFGEHGRPEIDIAACPEGAGLRFNLSHTRGLVCCALTRERPIGVDAECERPMRDVGGIAARFFAPEEAAAVKAAGPPGSAAEAQVFRRLWTLKEAYVKALGRGISMGLDGFAFSLSDDQPSRIGLTCPKAGIHSAEHWRCLLLGVGPGRCSLAVALPAPTGASFEVYPHLDGEPTPSRPDEAGLTLVARTPGTEFSLC